jgi:hypothetical protein
MDKFETGAQSQRQASGGASDGRRAGGAVDQADHGAMKSRRRATREGHGEYRTRRTGRERQAGGRVPTGRPVVGDRNRDQRSLLVQRHGDQPAASIRRGGRARNRHQRQMPSHSPDESGGQRGGAAAGHGPVEGSDDHGCRVSHVGILEPPGPRGHGATCASGLGIAPHGRKPVRERPSSP